MDVLQLMFGDDLQLQSLRRRDGDIAEADQEHEPGQPRQHAGDGERQEHIAPHRQAGGARGVRVRADRVKPPANGQVAQGQLPQNHDHQRDADHQAKVIATGRYQRGAGHIIQPVR